MKENYLAKWLSGDLSDEELKSFRNFPEFSTYQRIAEVASRLQGPDFDVEEALTRSREGRTSESGKVIRLIAYKKVLRIAAVIVVLLGITYYFTSTSSEQVIAGYAQHTEVTLPDASEVMLNSGSEVAYLEENWDKKRNVLLQGEAYFKVAKGQTFSVETPSGTVRVLGTQFNVLQREDIFIVSCYEGLVRVDYGETSHLLPAGKGFRVVDGKTELFDTEATEPSWMVDESSFRSMPLSFVLEELERQYNLEVAIEGVDTEVQFTGTFSNTNLDLALQSISTPLKLGYSIEGDKVLIYARNAP